MAKKKLLTHPWRLCPYGEHWVKTHSMRVPPSKTYPGGYTTIRHEHCARNPSGKDQLYPDEILEMSEKHFNDIKQQPCSLELGFKDTGNQFDHLIAGWTQYWNDIFKPKALLTPNIVKALIASESGFNPNRLANKKNSNSARGLMQVLNTTRKALGDEKGDLKDHYLTITKTDLNDPSINICSGIRWLFEKQRLASAYLERDSTWEEAIKNYKGKLKKPSNDPETTKQMKIFNEYLRKLNNCEKK
jgi:hypothetical protein